MLLVKQSTKYTPVAKNYPYYSEFETIRNSCIQLRWIRCFNTILYVLETALVVRAAGDRPTKLGSFPKYQTRGRDVLAAPRLKLQFRVNNPLVIGIKFINNILRCIFRN